jgi:hypothetical protein
VQEDGLLPVASLTDDAHIVTPTNQRNKPFPHDGMVIRNQNPNHPISNHDDSSCTATLPERRYLCRPPLRFPKRHGEAMYDLVFSLRGLQPGLIDISKRKTCPYRFMFPGSTYITTK